MNDFYRVLLFTFGICLGGCAVVVSDDIFSSHAQFHRTGTAPESFVKPWKLER